jgi:2-methylisocitrate lyase-like PEP mutase family enzyme
MRQQRSPQLSAIDAFRALHVSGCFVMPNPWDAGSAVFLEHAGFQALATTSSGFAFTRAKPDEVRALPRDAVLQHFRDLVAATSLPVNADFQNGYADEPEEVAANVALCVATGVAGLSIEDATGREESPLYDADLALERLKAARRAIDDSRVPVLLTARSEAWLAGAKDPKRTALERLVAFAEAGADCLFAPGVRDANDIAELVRAVAPKPLNALVPPKSPALTMQRLADLGVRRISVGSALARVAWSAFMRSARDIAATGSFASFDEAVSFAELNALFAGRD